MNRSSFGPSWRQAIAQEGEGSTSQLHAVASTAPSRKGKEKAIEPEVKDGKCRVLDICT
jgi:hypothetical protein